jgi:hypothetical protein
MQRRTFFKSVATNLAFIFVPRWARSQMAATEQPITYHDIAVVVLPESLGPKGISDTTEAFEAWLHDYKAGVDAGSGYGFTRQTVTGPNPSLHYPEQMKLPFRVAPPDATWQPTSWPTSTAAVMASTSATTLRSASPIAAAWRHRPSAQHR